MIARPTNGAARIIPALDSGDAARAQVLAESLAPHCGLLKVGLEALSHRLLTLIALILNAIVVAGCMLYPDNLRVVTGLLFAVTCWCLINIQRKG